MRNEDQKSDHISISLMLNKYFIELKNKIPKWKNDISASKIKGTGIEGIAHKASSRFESIVREALIKYIDICSLKKIYYGRYPNDKIDKLTLGELIKRINFLNDSFKTNYYYLTVANGKLIPIVSLSEINDLRILLEHYPERNEPQLIKNTISLLDHIDKMMGHPFFNILET